MKDILKFLFICSMFFIPLTSIWKSAYDEKIVAEQIIEQKKELVQLKQDLAERDLTIQSLESEKTTLQYHIDNEGFGDK